MANILLVDGHNTLFRAYWKFKQKGFKGPSGVDTGAVYGFMKILHANIFRFQINQVIVTFDHRRSPIRKKLLPQYKEGRPNLAMDYESIMIQKRIICKILRQMGVVYICDTKDETVYEGDDFIALMFQKNVVGNKVYILSSDEDFAQFICKGAHIINPSKDCVINKRNCEEIYGYTPDKALDMKMLTGDSSDNIPGYKGFGAKTATKFLEDYGSIFSYLNNDLKHKKVDNDTMRNLYKLNTALIDLNYFITQYPLEDEQIPYRSKKQTMNLRILYIIFDKYGLKSFKIPEFIQPFKKLKKYEH